MNSKVKYVRPRLSKRDLRMLIAACTDRQNRLSKDPEANKKGVTDSTFDYLEYGFMKDRLIQLLEKLVL